MTGRGGSLDGPAPWPHASSSTTTTPRTRGAGTGGGRRGRIGKEDSRRPIRSNWPAHAKIAGHRRQGRKETPTDRRISLALTFHNHQPVGNFGWVIEETYQRAYLPMLQALERHPAVRVTLHYTGPLMAWLRAEQPAFLDRLRSLVARGQVEIAGGGWYEPVLASLPERDRVAQLGRMADELTREFGTRPRGAWLAERVWEPDLPTALVDGGYQWTILDDAHFRAAAIPEDQLWGPYTTDDQGKVLIVFGTEYGLRYHIPFSPVETVIGHLRDNATEAGDRLGTMGDDGEKFGAWPTTYEHCWENGWVDAFFSALEANRDWLRTVTPSRWLEDHRPIGRVYLPTGSYAEMGEWALPPDEALSFSRAIAAARAEGRPEVRWLRGAMWRNFQVRYREVNDLHKQMLRASDLVAGMPDGGRRDRALDHLLAGQSNDPYWHGLFGGVYLPDLRMANHSRLIAAEDLALGASAESGVVDDLDLDGRPEVLLLNEGEIVSVKPDAGAGIGRWDIRAARVALGAVMRRRPEAYHAKVREIEARQRSRAAGHATGDAESAVTSIHELLTTKQEGLSERLRYDADERRSGLLRFLLPAATPETLDSEAGRDRGDFVSGGWTVEGVTPDEVSLARDGTVSIGGASFPVRATHTVGIGGGRLDPVLVARWSVTNDGRVALTARIATEWSTMLLGGGGNPAAYLEVAGRRVTHDSRVDASGVDGFESGNETLGVRLTSHIEPSSEVWIAPIETVSNSESGFELVYQGSTATIGRLVTLRPGESTTFSVEWRVAVAADRAADEERQPSRPS